MPELFLVNLSVSGMPQFFCLSLLHRFWLSRLFIYLFSFERKWLLGLMITANHHRFLTWRTSSTLVCFVRRKISKCNLHVERCLAWNSCIWMHNQVNWELPFPRLILRVFICKEKELLLQGSKWLTRDYLPYFSSVWELKQCLTSSAKFDLKEY